MAQRGKKDEKDKSQSTPASSLTGREVALLLQTLRPEETQFVKLCEQNDVLKSAEAVEVLADIPPGAPRDHIGSLLLKAGKLSQLEYNVILGQSIAPAAPSAAMQSPPAPVTSGSPTVVSQDPRPAAPPAPAPASGGTYFGKYRILSELARGGMGIVYTAKQEELDRVVCLKVLLSGEFSTKDQIERFFQEARSAAKLSHVNIDPIYDMGEINGQYYFTMEYIQGRSLDSLIGGRPMEPSVVAFVAMNVAKGLQVAHENGVIHRDIKPSNVLVKTNVTSGGLSADDWDRAEIKVVDFGLARQVQKQTERLTVSRAIMGTPFYMSPEQARGEMEKVDARSDVYSLGAVMYETLTGTPPMGNLPLNEILRRAGDEKESAPPPSTLQRAVDPVLEIVCMKAMRKNPKHRYASAGEMGEDMERYLKGEKILAKPPGLLEAWDWRSPKAWASAAGILLALCGGVWGVMNYTALGPPKEISWLDAPLHIGKNVIVEMPVKAAFRNEKQVSLVPKPGDKTAFEAIIHAQDFGAFPEKFERNEGYWMRLIKVTGKIESDNGKPFIRVRASRQVQVIRKLAGKDRGEWASRQAEALIPDRESLINWKEAINHLDQVKTVEGVIEHVSKTDAGVFMFFKRSDKTAFMAAVFSANWDAFPAGFESLYLGKKVWVAGKIISYKGQPEILIYNPAQIKIIGEGVVSDEFSPVQKNLISHKDALKYINQTKTVEGSVERASRTDRVAFLDFKAGSKTDFRVAVFASYYANFPDGFDQLYQGKKIWVAGTIETYQGRPQMVIQHPSQIKLVE